MPTVDSHCHASDVWYEPIESLISQMERNRVDHAILIQINGQTNNAYQTECLRRYPGRFASVVIVDTDRPDAADELARLAEAGASGVRFKPATRSPGADPLAIWRAAARLGLGISCGGGAADFAADDFARVVESVPEARIVIEHLGAVSHPIDAASEALRQKVFGLSRYPNTYIKIPGLGEFCRRAMPVKEPFPFEEPIPPLLEQAYAAFGAARMMWGSDYPPVSGREGYRRALNGAREQFAARSEADRAKIFGEIALSVFPIRK
jgi:predicted TIM-barrel fold metal-dependent hydrolase